eukprot:2702497-Heterocapsa_arctica.AAC.1
MDRIVLHSEVTAARTCVKEANPSPDNLGPLCGEKLQCITCAAKFTTANFNQDTFDVANSSIVDGWASIKAEPNFHNFTVEAKIDRMAGIMADKGVERTKLAKLGASRLTRREQLQFMRSLEKTQNYYALMAQTKNPAGAYQLGYI